LLTQCLEIQPHETIYSNRAASFIALHDYKRALEDCQAGIRLNPAFAKIYKRLFKAHICLGNVAEAKQALDIAIEADPNDSTNKSDKNLMEEVLH
jgi:tetratricopeptide (TPR) repeat protein